ncbi:hypothetical protein CDD83_5474 [Cordyceps sp. RAO-2017]|nr:hypothetical protein CDD83_5474 [Cordyceps sp. RAO-2017]
MELPYVILDVFTDTPYRGNPLAVVTIPASGPAPTQAQKQAVAREFNLSETVFVHDVPDRAADVARRLDIFLPFAEIAFAGHPTIGAAVALRAQGVTTLVTRAGPIAVAPLAGPDPGLVRVTVPHCLRLHAASLRPLALPEALLPSVPAIRERELDAPVFSIVNGVSFLLTQLPDLDLLARVEQSTARFPVDRLLDDGWRRGFLGRYYFVRTGRRLDPDGQPVLSLRTRMIEHSFEDPATGSAACCLSAYLSTVGDKQTTPTCRYEITQGVEMGKESNIVVDVTLRDGQLHEVKLAGTAVQVMRGHLTI